LKDPENYRVNVDNHASEPCPGSSTVQGERMYSSSVAQLQRNHLLLLSRTEYRKCAVFLLRDLDTQRVYRLYDFTKALLLRPGVASVAGKATSADKLYLVVESVRLDTKHSRVSNAHAPADGAGRSPIG
jgi:hypothetical protein